MVKNSLADKARKRFEARNMLEALARERKVGMRDIVGRYRAAEFVDLRVEFMKRASTMGLSCIMIGRIIKRDHSTVLYHLNGWRPRKNAVRAARMAQIAGEAARNA